MENKLNGTTDIYTVCTNESILTIDDKTVGENIQPFVARCKITGQPCTVQPIPLGDIVASFGGSPSSGQGNNVWLNYAQPFGDIDELILTEKSFFLCAVGMTKVEISDPAQYDVRVGDSHKIYEAPVFPVGGGAFNIGYDRNWNDFGPGAVHNSDFSLTQTDAHHVDGHLGVDIFAPKGAPIVAAIGGEVVSITAGGNSQSGGNRVWVKEDLGNGTSNHYYYPHLDSIDPNLNVGDTIGAGDTIGTLGNTGKHAQNTAPHLHFSIFEGVPNNFTGSVYSSNYVVDPFPFLESTFSDGEPLFDNGDNEAACKKSHTIDKLLRINDAESTGKLVAVDGAVISCPNAIPPPPPRTGPI